MEKVLSLELIWLVLCFEQEVRKGDQFVNHTADNVLSVWQIGAPIGQDSWYAIRLALLRALHHLVKGGLKVEVDDVHLLRQTEWESDSRPVWYSLEDCHKQLRRAGYLTGSETTHERVELVEKYFFRPEDVIGELEYEI